MKDLLVVFYSRSGTTRRLAHEIAVACGADLEEVRDVTPRGGLRGVARSVIDALLGRVPDIRPVEHHPEDYLITVLGGPVWLGRAPSPLHAYILENRRHFQDIAVFCTARGTFSRRMMRSIQVLCRRRPAVRMAFRARHVHSGRHRADAREFVEALNDRVVFTKQRLAEVRAAAEGENGQSERPVS